MQYRRESYEGLVEGELAADAGAGVGPNGPATVSTNKGNKLGHMPEAGIASVHSGHRPGSGVNDWIRTTQ